MYTTRSSLILCPPSEKEDNIKEKEALESCDACKRHTTTSKTKKSKSSNKISSPSSPTTRPTTINPLHIISDTMYTNVANLQQTMLLQQQLFRQALGQNFDITSKPTTSFTSPSLSQYQFVNTTQVTIKYHLRFVNIYYI